MGTPRRVMEIARRKVVTAHPDDPLSAIAKSMVDHWISSVVIVDNGKPVGIVTDGIIFRLIAKKRNPLKLVARDVMAHPVRTIHGDISLEDAECIFIESKVSRLIIVDAKGQLKGIISKKDVDRFGAYSLAEKLCKSRHDVLD